MARRKSIASLAVTLTARTTTFRKRMFAAKAIVKRFASGAIGLGVSFAKLGAAATLAGTAIATALVKRQFGVIDKLAKIAGSLNISTEKLAGFRLAARLGGVEVGQLDKSLQVMTKNIGEAASGTGEAKDAIEALGLNVKTLSQLDAATQFSLISEGIRKLGTQSLQASAAADIFGRQGVNLLNIFKGGAAGLRRAAGDARQFGLAISAVAARQVENANDAFTRLKALLEGVVRQVSVNIAPFAEAFANHFVEMGRAGRTMGETVVDAMENVTLGVSNAVSSLRLFKIDLEAFGFSVESVFGSIQDIVGGFGPSARAARREARARARQQFVNQRITNLAELNPQVIKGNFDEIRRDAAERARRAIGGEFLDRTFNRLQNILDAPRKSDFLDKLFEIAASLGTGRKSKASPSTVSGGAIQQAMAISPLLVGAGRGKPVTVKSPDVVKAVKENTKAVRTAGGVAIVGP